MHLIYYLNVQTVLLVNSIADYRDLQQHIARDVGDAMPSAELPMMSAAAPAATGTGAGAVGRDDLSLNSLPQDKGERGILLKHTLQHTRTRTRPISTLVNRAIMRWALHYTLSARARLRRWFVVPE